MDDFLFVILLCGIIIATVQDLRRREVDNWLNFFLLFSGIITLLYVSLFMSNFMFFLRGLFALGLGFVCMHLFYMGRVFAGGDAKLLFALSPFFVGATFFMTFLQFGIFTIFLLFSGGMWGLCYSFVLYIRNFSLTTQKIKEQLLLIKVWWFVIVGSILLVLSFFQELFLVFGCLIIIFPFLFSFAKALESTVMMKYVPGTALREGDWLVNDVRVGKTLVKATFDGVTKDEITLLLSKKKVLIRDGIPFVPGFLIAFVLYYFYSEFILTSFQFLF